jgi:hypothetical protein
MKALLLAGIVAAGLAPLSATSDERAAAGLSNMSRAPAADVLDDLARRNGMTIAYVDMDRPRQLVSIPTDARASTAVVEVLKQLGVGYALKTRKAGGDIETLIIVGSGTPPSPGRAKVNETPTPAATENRDFVRPDRYPVSARRARRPN